MLILGIHHGHDSCAALIRDGEIVADVAEERFTRIKHYCGLPFHSVRYCLEAAGIASNEIDVVAIASKYQRPDLNHLFDFPGAKMQQESNQRKALNWIREMRGYAPPHPPLYIRPFPLKPSVEVLNVQHHLAHAAGAYHTSGSNEKQLIVTMDGSGDDASTALWRGENGRIEPLDRFGFEGSLGAFYSLVTEGLGWWHGDGEGKTMGLAPYGDAAKAGGKLDRFTPRFENGRLVGPKDFGSPQTWSETGAMHFHLRKAEDVASIIQACGREHIAAEAQRLLEEQAFSLVLPWLEREGHANLTCSGGVFLNVKLNQRFWESGKVQRQWIYPNAGDSGLAVGAALHAWHTANPSAPNGSLSHLYHGPSFSPEEIRKLLELRKVAFREVEDPASSAAELLSRDKIVAWFQGRMESGPRALGNRSILMSANRAVNKDIINARVKFREGFRPFCPSLIEEAKADYLINPRDEPFMITSFTCTEAKRARVPAVVHADHTLRPQTVSKAINPLYHQLLTKFGQLTGEPLLLNTSLNIMGEPMICHPRDAIRCFYDCGLDSMLLGSFLLEKKGAA
jgi:carbamoyltransferase